MKQPLKRVALGISLDTSYGRQKVQGVLSFMRRHQQWDIPLRQALPLLSEKELMRWTGDGAIIETYSDEVARAFTERGIPVVNTYSQQLDPPLPTVTVDNVAVGRMAAEHLINKGLDRFAFVGLKGLRYCEDRLAGFSETLARHACTCETCWICGDYSPNRLTHPEPYVQTLSSLAKPIGVFATNDRVGFGVLAACRQLGLASPDSLALIAVDNDETLCALAVPQMTSIQLEAERIGYLAAEKLARMMADKRAWSSWDKVQPHTVVQRHSSDVRSVADPLVAEALRVIRNRAQEGLDVSDVMQTLPGSRRALERKFRSYVGHGIYEEIRRVRIERAQTLLRETRLSVASVARQCGFNSITRFGVTFREWVGVSAADYRYSEKQKQTPSKHAHKGKRTFKRSTPSSSIQQPRQSKWALGLSAWPSETSGEPAKGS